MLEIIKTKINKGIIMYLIFGVLTTILNFIVFLFCSQVLKIDVLIANIIAWIAGVIFAFITNKFFVFESKTKDLKVFIKELNSFVASRLLTLGMEEIIIFIFITQLNFNSTIIKIIAQFLVIVFNYIFSKIFVFKKSL